jgi:hypothetical protein
MINMLEDREDRNPVKSNLQRMITVPRKLNLDQLLHRLIPELQIAQETIVINRSDEAKRK